MGANLTTGHCGHGYRVVCAAAFALALFVSGAARAQSTGPALSPPPRTLDLSKQTDMPTSAPASYSPSGIQQVSCRGCTSGLHMASAGCGAGGCGAHCYPGQFCDHEPGQHEDTVIARIWCGFYECLCCPDPCYQPRWVAVANSAFFADQVRPATQMRLRWDATRNGLFRDRAEVIHARADGRGKGPRTPPVASFDMDQFYYYMEGATERFGLAVEIPYRAIDPEFTPIESGFADMNVTTKSLLLDCELLQVTFQFRTYIPIGQASKGLGTGHVSLEPSLLWALKFAPSTYLQGQAAYLIPIGGDEEYAGDVFHYHFSLNQVIWKPLLGVQVIGTAELNGWSVLNGLYTLPTAGGGTPVRARGHILSAGPGLRVVICDKIDFGVGTAFAATSDKWAEQMYRAEFRWRF